MRQDKLNRTRENLNTSDNEVNTAELKRCKLKTTSKWCVSVTTTCKGTENPIKLHNNISIMVASSEEANTTVSVPCQCTSKLQSLVFLEIFSECLL